LVSVVGDDEPGETLARILGDEAVEAHLRRDAEFSTTVKLRVLGRQQQLIRIDFEKRPSHEILSSQLEVFEQLLPESDVVILSDYGKGGLQHIRQMIEWARALGKLVLVDPKGQDYERYRGATLLTPNRSEFRDVVGPWQSEEEMTRKAESLRQALGLEALLVTRSEEGMSLYEEGLTTHIPAKAKEVFDVSGAGDTVIATMAVMLAVQKDKREAMRVANSAAGVVVGKLGTATVSADELAHELRGAE
jgi:rfaE bifunctional protein kinase chain/domain